GRYHFHYSYYNSHLDVEGVVSVPLQAASGTCRSLETRIKAGQGGIAFGGVVSAPSGYETTHCRVYTTMGNTEVIESSGNLREDLSYRAAMDAELALPGTPGMNKGDQALDWSNLFTNEGGMIPPATIGAWSGAVGLYGGFTKMYVGGSTITGDAVCYSKFGRPTMVPLLITYSVTAYGDDPSPKSWTDSRTVWPKGGHHFLPSPCDGEIVEIVAAGGTIVLYTATSTWVMRSTPQGKLYAVKRKEGIGCVGHPAATAFEFEAHALGERAWTVTTATGFSEISSNTWSTTLEDIPVAQQTDAVMAAFPSKDQVWCAVTKSGATTPQRILVLDMSLGSRELTVFELADDAWETSEYITAMCELAYAGAEQTMLVATNHGRIFQYPSGADDDGNDFQATWRGVFGAERSAYTQRMEVAEIHAGDNCQGRVRWSVRPKRESGDTPPQASAYLGIDNAINTCNGVADKVDARFWEIEISSPPVGSGETATTWTVHDILLRIGRTDTQ
ncbi:MAG TPA: hypothetical protein VMY37_02935, partial [Thermoguttaceae bacterium]|nr:hypothetical protein [Thermoguttaceae bacterium]